MENLILKVIERRFNTKIVKIQKNGNKINNISVNSFLTLEEKNSKFNVAIFEVKGNKVKKAHEYKSYKRKGNALKSVIW